MRKYAYHKFVVLFFFVCILGFGLTGCSAIFGGEQPEEVNAVGSRAARRTPHRPVVVQGTVVPQEPIYEMQLPLRDTPKVRKFFYAFRDRSRSFIEESLPRYQAFSPMFDRILRKYGLPLELSSVALIESRFQQSVRSPMGAVGLWQLMAATARNYGLRVTLFLDERKNPEKSTEAAAQYFADLYDQFGDWLLVLAAYNAGPARIASVIKSSDTVDFFELDQKGLIPEETSNFVHKVIAVALIFRRLDAYGFKRPDSNDGQSTVESKR